eukprot:TRINITY_DN50542_c0_g1_i1.p2 TRINITY_DN50542_c0_g1~~TRINITY_DN50542_c0_g1_i1.p2  ORF type:complete len:225 (+),score=44.82 TRINITY_DN50542_c0_g1_i1:88-762(+)
MALSPVPFYASQFDDIALPCKAFTPQPTSALVHPQQDEELAWQFEHGLSATPPTSARDASDVGTAGPETEPRRLAHHIADLLNTLASKQQHMSGCGSPFTCPGEVTLSLSDFVAWLATHTRLSVVPFVVALIYIDRLDAMHHDMVCPGTIHKLFLAALSVAHKAHEEYQLPHRSFAAIGGVTPDELGDIETALLAALGWEVGVDDQDFAWWHSLLSRRATASQQ